MTLLSVTQLQPQVALGLAGSFLGGVDLHSLSRACPRVSCTDVDAHSELSAHPSLHTGQPAPAPAHCRWSSRPASSRGRAGVQGPLPRLMFSESENN